MNMKEQLYAIGAPAVYTIRASVSGDTPAQDATAHAACVPDGVVRLKSKDE
jgi:hypothetical protein